MQNSIWIFRHLIIKELLVCTGADGIFCCDVRDKKIFAWEILAGFGIGMPSNIVIWAYISIWAEIPIMWSISFFVVEFFPIMLIGAIVCFREKMGHKICLSMKTSCVAMMVCLGVYYGFKVVIMNGWIDDFSQIQLLSVLALYLFFPAAYWFFSHSRVAGWIRFSKWIMMAVYFVSSLTLEIYVVNGWVIGLMPREFPLNIPVAYGCILAAAFVLKVLTNAFLQMLCDRKIDFNRLFVVD